ncbi:hypothetical protein D3C72_1425250 [compost metagenome]
MDAQGLGHFGAFKAEDQNRLGVRQVGIQAADAAQGLGEGQRARRQVGARHGVEGAEGAEPARLIDQIDLIAALQAHVLIELGRHDRHRRSIGLPAALYADGHIMDRTRGAACCRDDV